MMMMGAAGHGLGDGLNQIESGKFASLYFDFAFFV
jgi:hypothetical protein